MLSRECSGRLRSWPNCFCAGDVSSAVASVATYTRSLLQVKPTVPTAPAPALHMLEKAILLTIDGTDPDPPAEGIAQLSDFVSQYLRLAHDDVSIAVLPGEFVLRASFVPDVPTVDLLSLAAILNGALYIPFAGLPIRSASYVGPTATPTLLPSGMPSPVPTPQPSATPRFTLSPTRRPTLHPTRFTLPPECPSRSSAHDTAWQPVLLPVAVCPAFAHGRSEPRTRRTRVQTVAPSPAPVATALPTVGTPAPRLPAPGSTTFRWVTSAWSDCDKTCGIGIVSRYVYCLRACLTNLCRSLPTP